MSEDKPKTFESGATMKDLRAAEATVVRQVVIRPTKRVRVPVVGDVVDDIYEILSTSDRGRFVVSHRLLDQSFELRRLKGAHDDDLSEVENRVRLASLVANTNLGVIVDLGRCPLFGHYAVVEAGRGTRLTDLLRRNEPISAEEVVKLAIEVGGALGALHEVGVAHGLEDLRDIVLGPDGVWRLHAAGLPTDESQPMFRAPEIKAGDWPTPASDQWVFAAVLNDLLARRDDDEHLERVPAAAEAAIQRAMQASPSARWPEVENMLDKFQLSVHARRQPSMVPFDAREVSRLLGMHPDLSHGFGGGNERTRQSVLIQIADLRDAKPRLTFAFRNVGRLRREYRHNLVHGGLFVPSPTELEVSAQVTLVLEFEPKKLSVEIDGIVTHYSAGDDITPPGAGVVFGEDGMEKVLGFLRDAGVIKGVASHDWVSRSAEFTEDESLTAEQLFLYSIVVAPTRVAELRAAARSLPFAFEDTLVLLLESGALLRTPGEGEHSDQSQLSLEATDVDMKFTEEDVLILLEEIEFHRDRFSFIAALTLAERSVRHLPDEPRLQHQLAFVQSHGRRDLQVARKAATRAVALDSSRREYQRTLAQIEAQIEGDAIRRVYSREFPVTDVYFVGWDASSDCIWVKTRSALAPDRLRLLGIDIVRDAIVHSETLDDARDVHFIWSPIHNSGEQPAIFRGPRPVALSRNAWALDRDPRSGDKGTFVRLRDGQLRELSTQAGADYNFSPDGTVLLWTQTEGDESVLIAAPLEGEPVELHRSAAGLTALWADSEDRPVVFDSGSGAVAAVDLDGAHVETGRVLPGFEKVVCAVDRATALVLRHIDDTTTLEWVELPTGNIVSSLTLDAMVFDLVLSDDGCAVGRSRVGTVLADLRSEAYRHVEGIRLVPATLHGRRWLAPASFVSMALRPNALELVALNPSMLFR